MKLMQKEQLYKLYQVLFNIINKEDINLKELMKIHLHHIKVLIIKRN